MAYIQRMKSGKIKAYYYKGKPIQIPAAEVNRIIPNPQDLSDHEIKLILEQWTVDNGVARVRSQRLTNYSDSAISSMLDEYFEDRKLTSRASESTLKNERSLFNNYILPFFVGEKGLKDVKEWINVAYLFIRYLDEHEAFNTHKTANQIIFAFNRFGRFLFETRRIPTQWKQKTIKNKQGKAVRTTPLPKECFPEEVIEFARKLKTTRPDFAATVLLGYFAALRPSEAQALIWPDDFLTGAAARIQSHTYERLKKHSYRNMSLANAFAVKITKSVKDLPKERQIGETKTPNSNGVVTVWYPPAVQLLVEILKEMPRGPVIQPMHKTTFFKKIRNLVKNDFGLTAHSLRRSSALFLARTIGVDPYLLQDHMRHVDPATTHIYTRRPADNSVLGAGDGNLDDVLG